MAYETLEYEVRDAVAFVTLAREKAANTLNLQMAKELLAVALAAREDRRVRAVLLGGRGRFFCAGGDLGSFSAAKERVPALIKEMTVHLHAAIAIFARLDAPVVAAVNGAAAGAGFSLVCAADLAVAAESAQLTMAYTRAGLAPDGGSTWFLPRLLGRRRTLELMLLNRALSAREALEWGIVNQVVPDAELESAAAELAARLAAGPTRAFGWVKKLVTASGDHGLETQMEHEGDAIAASASTPDGQEGIAAFLAKRAPEFGGA
jgi:2-(1,2-epoxy-1,2-dihydrophenyl)acetyl-CoA isomerase